jgi:D-glycero-D-manno-heptose 1,7-bisphosphate phosphatase
MTRAVFLDRDGVINRKMPEGSYVTCWEDFEFLPGAVEAIRTLKENGWLAIVATNQRAVARGLMSPSDLEHIHQKMTQSLRREGAAIDALYCCPHGSEDNCECRKPEPGMLLLAAREHGIDLSSSWMVGDTMKDVQAGKAAGCRTILIQDKHLITEGAESTEANRGATHREAGDERRAARERLLPDAVASSLADAAAQIVAGARGKS